MVCDPIPPRFTLVQYQALSAAAAQGALMVRYADKTVQYRSLSEMMELLRLMELELFPCSNNGNSGRKFAEFNKGLC